MEAYQAPPPMGFSGKSNGVGCHCLLHKGPAEGPKSLILRDSLYISLLPISYNLANENPLKLEGARLALMFL